MAKKKRPDTPAKPAQFHTAPFSQLKGAVTVAPPPKAVPPVEVVVPPPPDDASLFLDAMTGVKKLTAPRQETGKGTASPGTGAAVPARPAVERKSPDKTAADELFLKEIGKLKLEIKFSETLPDEDELKPLSGNRLKQLKRGVVSVDYQLDLHGLTRDEAIEELPRFLRTARAKRQTAVLVITGKGNNSSGEPVLQQAVAAWLRDTGRELVLEYAPAPREMGGSGAFVVFLRPAPTAVSESAHASKQHTGQL
jgi:DNA-nicking Smr family endonuclease